jgi:hypothetical protein
MTNEEHSQIIHEIAQNLSDQGKVTELLTKLSDDYTSTNAKLSEYDTKVPQLESDMESLRKSNMALFVKVGAEIKDPPPTPTDPPTDPPKDDTETDPYKELFNEKGELI